MNLDERIHHFVNLRNEKKDTINAMLEMQLVELKKDSQTLVVQFPLQSWEMNPVNHTHGGILSAMLDVAMGGAAYVFSQAVFTPTIQLAVNFVKGSTAGDVLRIEATCDHAGSRMAMTRAVAYDQEGNVIASANGAYAINTKSV